MRILIYFKTIGQSPKHICWASDSLSFDKGQSWSWSDGSWIYNYLCNQCLSSLMLWFRIPLRRGVRDTTICDKVSQWLAICRWFSPSTPVSSTNKTDRHDNWNIVETGVKHHNYPPLFWQLWSPWYKTNHQRWMGDHPFQALMQSYVPISLLSLLTNDRSDNNSWHLFGLKSNDCVGWFVKVLQLGHFDVI